MIIGREGGLKAQEAKSTLSVKRNIQLLPLSWHSSLPPWKRMFQVQGKNQATEYSTSTCEQ